MTDIALTKSMGLKFDLSSYILSQKYSQHLRVKFEEYIIYLGGGGHSPKEELSKYTIGMKAELFDCADNPALGWYKQTSGTSGPRKYVAYSNEFYFESQFLNPRKILASAGHDALFFGKLRLVSINGNTFWGDSLHLDPINSDVSYIRLSFDELIKSSFDKMLLKLLNLKPDIVFLKPSIAKILLSGAQDRGLSLKDVGISIIVSSGQTLHSGLKEQLKTQTGAELYDVYACTEFGIIGIKKESTFLVDQTSIEINSLESTELVCWSSTNSVMRFQSYKIGDKGIVTGTRDGKSYLELRSARNSCIYKLKNGLFLDPSRFDCVAFEKCKMNNYATVFDGRTVIIYVDHKLNRPFDIKAFSDSVNGILDFNLKSVDQEVINNMPRHSTEIGDEDE